MSEETLQDQPEPTIFNSISLLLDLFKNKVPPELKDRLTFDSDSTSFGVTKEVYRDTKTGDTFVSGMIPTSPVGCYRTVTTKAGEYHWISYHEAGGHVVGVEFFYNRKKTDKDTFFTILWNQTGLPKPESPQNE